MLVTFIFRYSSTVIQTSILLTTLYSNSCIIHFAGAVPNENKKEKQQDASCLGWVERGLLQGKFV